MEPIAQFGSLATIARMALEALFGQPSGGMGVQAQPTSPTPRWNPEALAQILQRLQAQR